MGIELYTLSGGPLQWENDFPSSIKGLKLPGSRILSAVGNFGSVSIQEFSSPGLLIRFNVFDLIQRVVVKSFFDKPGIYTKLLLKGKVDHQVNANDKFLLQKNQFALFPIQKAAMTGTHEKDSHISFDAFISLKLARELLNLFPSYKEQADHRQAVGTSSWADGETLNLVYSMLQCKYENDLLTHFFKARIKDLLFQYLLITSNKLSSGPNTASKKEVEAVYAAEQIITENIAVHYSIPVLSKKVLLNESRFKFVFKKIFGSGPYDYLIRKRLARSKELLEEGCSIKEAAEKVGYRPSDFTVAFQKQFGYPPSFIRQQR